MDYEEGVEFEWDDAKNRACAVMRGFDFVHASKAFSDPLRSILRDGRENYGEERFELTGAIAGRVYVVIFTPRNGKVRIISARKANRREVARYGNRSNEDRHENAGDGEDWLYR